MSKLPYNSSVFSIGVVICGKNIKTQLYEFLYDSLKLPILKQKKCLPKQQTSNKHEDIKRE